jgi:hypothetical protein
VCGRCVTARMCVRELVRGRDRDTSLRSTNVKSLRPVCELRKKNIFIIVIVKTIIIVR